MRPPEVKAFKMRREAVARSRILHWRWVTVICIGLFVGSVVGEVTTAVPADSTPPPVIVSENVATLHVSRSIWSILPFVQPPRDVVLSFVVRAATPSKQAIAITSSGLGKVCFSLDEKGGIKGPATAEPFLQLEVDQRGSRINVRLPNELFVTPGTAEGKVVVLPANSRPVEIPLKVEWLPSPLLTSIEWFVAILVPTGITALVGLFVTHLTMRASVRSTELAEFRKFKDANSDKLRTFFEGFYPTAREKQNPAEFARELRTSLLEQNILEVIARRERQNLETAFRKKRRNMINRHLKQLFPEWEDMIEES